MRAFKLAALAAALLLAVLRQAPAQVQQSGPVTPGHAAYWVTNNVVADAGSSSQGLLTSLGVTSPGSAAFCINSGTITSPYNALCFGVNVAGSAAVISLTPFNAATALPLDVIVNGQTAISVGTNGVVNIPTLNFTGANITNGTVTNSTITGGTINGAVIGGATPAAGTFTTLNATTALQNTTVTDTRTFTLNGAPTASQYSLDITVSLAGNTTTNGYAPLTVNCADNMSTSIGQSANDTVAQCLSVVTATGGNGFFGSRQAIFSQVEASTAPPAGSPNPLVGWNFVAQQGYSSASANYGGVGAFTTAATSAATATGSTLTFTSVPSAVVTYSQVIGTNIPFNDYADTVTGTTVVLHQPVIGTGVTNSQTITFATPFSTTVNTSTSAAVNAGATSIPVQSTAGIVAGMYAGGAAGFSAHTYVSGAPAGGSVPISPALSGNLANNQALTFVYDNWQGQSFGGNDNTFISSGATSWEETFGREIDVTVKQGGTQATTERLVGLLIDKAADNGNVAADDEAIAIGSSATTPFAIDYAVNSGWSGWPLQQYGSIMAAVPATPLTANPGNNYVTGYGINLLGITFNYDAFVSNGFAVDPSGNVTGNSFTGPIGGNTAAAGAFTTLSASGAVSGAGFSTYLASPPAIGGTAPAAGAFTSLSASGTVSGTGFSNYLASPPAIGSSAPASGAFTSLAASGAVSGSGFSTYLASPPGIGGTAPAAGAFTTLAASGTVSGVGFSAYLASPPAIGGTSPAAGAFTTLAAAGHVSSSGSAPAVSSCGSTPSISGTDTKGAVTVGSGTVTACTITFNASYTTTPVVVVTANVDSITLGITALSDTAFTVGSSGNMAGDVIYYYAIQ